MPEQAPAGRIMVVDDMADNRDILVRRLGRLGFEVEEAASGRAALDVALAEPPDLIVLDYMMPGMSGLDVVDEIRRYHDRAILPIIMVTARADQETVVECLEHGANDFVPKPVDFQVLCARIQTQLERRRSTLDLNWMNQDLERLVARRTAELQRQNESLRQAFRELEAADRAKTQFLASISHELRTPLNAVIGLAELLDKQVLGPLEPPKYRTFAAELLRSGHYLLGIISGVLEATRIENEVVEIDPAPLALDQLLSECIAMVQRAAARLGPGQPPEFETSLEPIELPADRGKLQQALFNVLSNAAKFSPPGAPILVACRREAGRAVVEVHDAGPGLPPGQEAAVLLPFVQLVEHSGVKPEGVGLGLHIANRSVKAHGGHIELVNREPHGLTARIVLPLAGPPPATAPDPA